MNNWEKFKNQQQNQRPTGKGPLGKEIGGSYMCQHCFQLVTTATYFPSESVLEYTCEEGHKSFIEKFFIS